MREGGQLKTKDTSMRNFRNRHRQEAISTSNLSALPCFFRILSSAFSILFPYHIYFPLFPRACTHAHKHTHTYMHMQERNREKPTATSLQAVVIGSSPSRACRSISLTATRCTPPKEHPCSLHIGAHVQRAAPHPRTLHDGVLITRCRACRRA